MKYDIYKECIQFASEKLKRVDNTTANKQYKNKVKLPRKIVLKKFWLDF
jgi:hypothetical protein